MFVKILDPRITPDMLKYATDESAGLDLFACLEKETSLMPGEVLMVSSGISIWINDPGYAALIMPRSGLGAKTGLVLANTVGLIDSDYQGTLTMALMNRTLDKRITLQPMTKVMQLVIVPVARPEFQIVKEYETNTIRGAGGYGSTGIH